MEFSPNVIKMFMFKISAKTYANRARRKGYKATVRFEGNNWFLLGGRWGVKLEDTGND